ncbi:hypothetical protein [Maribacter sp. 2210JD10-5]|uniref:hypothetical protein n=1 Tax=Maribacter sp. 2210JD10-5 TaxID=3386272 RepID=UPI0039BC49CB
MKTILTVFFIFFIGFAAMAQNTAKEVKVAALSQGVELNVTIKKSISSEAQITRLYRFKNSRIKKALSFTTKANRAKMA